MSLTIYLIIIALLVVMYTHVKIKYSRLKGDFIALKNQAITKDSLTGLYHRRFFNDYYLAESLKILSALDNITKPQQYHFFSLTLLRVNSFTSITQAYGNNLGDQILCQVASTLTDLVFSRDIVCRYNDHDFAILFINSGNHELVLQKSQLIKDNIEDLIITSDSGEVIKLAISSSSAFFDTDHINSDSFSMMKTAEKRLEHNSSALTKGQS